MLIRLIYEDPSLGMIKNDIANLDTKQLYFIERFIAQERKSRKQAIFNQWQKFLTENVENYSIK